MGLSDNRVLPCKDVSNISESNTRFDLTMVASFGISRMDKISDAKKKCPDLVPIHVATYKEG